MVAPWAIEVVAPADDGEGHRERLGGPATAASGSASVIGVGVFQLDERRERRRQHTALEEVACPASAS